MPSQRHTESVTIGVQVTMPPKMTKLEVTRLFKKAPWNMGIELAFDVAHTVKRVRVERSPACEAGCGELKWDVLVDCEIVLGPLHDGDKEDHYDGPGTIAH
jgi:hypothetical protein